MPWQPLKRCSYPSCKQRVKSGRCEEHRREQNRQRGTRTKRGYSNRWSRYRLMYLKTHLLCVHCLKQNCYMPATIVDHIIPIQGEADVLFWPASNHKALCQTCHNRKTVQTDPITKAKRKQGSYQEQEAEAVRSE
ncbi:HNH endonuclease signature motif containing protein [Xenorhabdus hominickii]|uniref:Putative HNH nuclease YajD n=1 Tax=Xenorhabdus hominickii TaxID=351679 RepID=A0A2G0Q4L2_XENHO|nr:HNH endonuclease [Xenorhabdus hominickii]AOM42431.1 HNH endonuclease [Xenorhabdus hominickii]PHM54164.1 HNH endonuclease [Xenorhabdus hominickii]